MTDELPYLVIGAGASGLSMARRFGEHGIPFEVVERHDGVGGLWDIDNPGTPVYETAHFISSKNESALADFPMPDDYPDYPGQQQLLAYLRAYAEHFDLWDAITFGTEARHLERNEDGGWTAWLRPRGSDADGEPRQYAGVVLCSGNFWNAFVPDIPGLWDGEAYHSQDYKSLDQVRGKRVLVVGAGNTGCDIACNAAVAADRATISVRRGYRIVPKHLFGIPTDVVQNTGPDLPGPVSQRLFNRLLGVVVGDLSDTGWPEPDHSVLASHPIVNTRIIDHLRHGDLEVAADVRELDGDTVRFADGSEERFDLIIWATGYRVAFPYLDDKHLDWEGNDPGLFINVFHRDYDDLFVLGIIETNGGAFPHISLQAQLVAEVVDDLRHNPRQAEVFRRVKQRRPDLSGGIEHVDSPRHDYYVEFATYLRYCRRLLELLERRELTEEGVPTGLDWAKRRVRQLLPL